MHCVGAIDALHAWAINRPALRVCALVIRALLAAAFVPSGLVKILDQPFTTLPVTDPVGYFFAGFFSAHGFYRFIGVAQWTAAACLLVPRTATLGACLYLPIIVNIFVLTVAIGPAFAFTRVVTGLMLLGNLYLLFWDWDRWRAVLPARTAGNARHGGVLLVLGVLVAAGVGLQGLVGLNMWRIRGTPYAGPLAATLLGASVGLVALVIAYRRAARDIATRAHANVAE
jgi:hypothetical protein